MLEWFTEDSTIPMVTGTLLTIIFLGFWVTSAERIMAFVAIAIAILTFATVTCETLIVTQQEEVTDTIYELASLVQANDQSGVVGYISETRKDTSDRAKQEMKRCQFDSCLILGKKYFKSHSETSTEICFVVAARGNRDGFSGTVREEITLHFKKENGRWCIVDYSHRTPGQDVSL